MNNSQYVKNYLVIRKTQHNLSHRTIKAYACDLGNFLAFIEDVPICSIDLQMLRNYLANLEERQLNPSSIRRKLATLRLFFNHLKEEGYIETSPAFRLQGKFRIPRHIPRIMSHGEIESLLSTAHKSIATAHYSHPTDIYRVVRNYILIEMLFALGIRIDELVRLDVRDINFESKTIVVFGKGRKERMLYISSDEVLLGLQEYLKTRLVLHPATDALFLNRARKRLSTHSVGTIFCKACNAAGITRHYTPHCLRHTMATMLIENGADVRSVQEILGHSSISTTELYLTVSMQRKRDVMNRFNMRNQLHIRPESILSTQDN